MKNGCCVRTGEFSSPHLGHIGSAVRLQFGHEDPHDVEDEDQVDLEIFISVSKTGQLSAGSN